MIDGILLAAWIGCQAFDVKSTLDALKHPGVYEANPLARGRRGLVIKASVNVGAFFAWRSLDRRAYRNIVAVSAATAGCIPAVLNRRYQ